jgi:hypothetical protein
MVLMAILAASILMPLPSRAQPREPGWYEGMPYGHSCPGRHWGPYGGRRAVKNSAEAKQAIEKYFAGSSRTLQVAITVERRWFYIAEITEPDGTLVDKLIIDKRTGRIRSIY